MCTQLLPIGIKFKRQVLIVFIYVYPLVVSCNFVHYRFTWVVDVSFKPYSFRSV